MTQSRSSSDSETAGSSEQSTGDVPEFSMLEIEAMLRRVSSQMEEFSQQIEQATETQRNLFDAFSGELSRSMRQLEDRMESIEVKQRVGASLASMYDGSNSFRGHHGGRGRMRDKNALGALKRDSSPVGRYDV